MSSSIQELLSISCESETKYIADTLLQVTLLAPCCGLQPCGMSARYNCCSYSWGSLIQIDRQIGSSTNLEEQLETSEQC